MCGEVLVGHLTHNGDNVSPRKWERGPGLRLPSVVACPDAVWAHSATDLWGWCAAWHGSLTAWQMAH